jgi:4-alpha-glucanotransferase
VKERSSGILLHITSLPSPFGIGDFGPDAYSFADFLADANQKLWQILPLNRTSTEYGNSPYSSFSAFAGNPLMISPYRMIKDGLLSDEDIKNRPKFSPEKVEYKAVTKYKHRIFNTAYTAVKGRLGDDNEFKRFCNDNSYWLDDYSLFISLKKHFNQAAWGSWPEEIRDRKKSALAGYSRELSDYILKEKFLQYLFFNQWSALKNYCESKNITIFGDVPIYVNYDSADVWANHKIFNLDKDKKPLVSAGVPPDYFSETGQLWGHPVYKWDIIRKTGYAWWIKRIEHNLKLYHMFRLDHFRGFVGYWQVHASEKTAINGQWVEAPARDFFKTVQKNFPDITIIAEDLGIITSDVKEIIQKFGFPGMKVLLFAFGDDLPTNPYAPHNHVKNCIIYTGTHDNNTIRGWYEHELNEDSKNRISEYIGREVTEENVHWELIRLVMMSVADTSIIPMQDVLGLGESYRMNLPGTENGNWEWRVKPEHLSVSLKERLTGLTRMYGRD